MLLIHSINDSHISMVYLSNILAFLKCIVVSPNLKVSFHLILNGTQEYLYQVPNRCYCSWLWDQFFKRFYFCKSRRSWTSRVKHYLLNRTRVLYTWTHSICAFIVLDLHKINPAITPAWMEKELTKPQHRLRSYWLLKRVVRWRVNFLPRCGPWKGTHPPVDGPTAMYIQAKLGEFNKKST